MHAAVLGERCDEVFCTDDPDEGEAFTAARRAAFPALERLGDLLLEDVGVALPALPTLVRGIGKIAAEHDDHHRSGGPRRRRQHPSADRVRRSRPGRDGAGERGLRRVMDLAIELGGTITGEHGVGRLKKAGCRPISARTCWR